MLNGKGINVVSDIDGIRDMGLVGREEIARKIGVILETSSDASDQKAAYELAKVLVEDAAVSVRQVLSETLSSCGFLPKEIILTITHDFDDISLPFLMASKAIDDELLETIVMAGKGEVQEAIACRSGLSEAVSFAISDVGSVGAIDKLVDNENADLSKRSFDRIVDRFPEVQSLMEKLVQRSDFPVEVVDRIIFKVSQKYGEYLNEKFGLSADYTSYLMSLTKRQVFSRTIEMAPLREMESYLRQLHETKSLSSDVLLNYLQNGHMRLFTSSLSTLMDMPYGDMEKHLELRDKKLLVRLLETIGFSKSVIGVLLIAFERLTQE